jgi:hypothetical protein
MSKLQDWLNRPARKPPTREEVLAAFPELARKHGINVPPPEAWSTDVKPKNRDGSELELDNPN